MTTRLKRRLADMGVDASSSKANESFCLVSVPQVSHRLIFIMHKTDRDSFASFGEVQGYWRVCSTMEAGCALSLLGIVHLLTQTRSETIKGADVFTAHSPVASQLATSILLGRKKVRFCMLTLCDV
jgi:hypothetical protein